MVSLFPRMLQDYTEAAFDVFDEKRRERVAGIKTRKAMEAATAKCRADFMAIYPLPKEKTPLRIRVTGEIPADGYSIRKLLFESRPGYLVSANLYLPHGRGPFPAAVVPCGHSMAGKAHDAYQCLCMGLAKKGFAVLIYDPIAQGERIEVPEFPGSCVREHILAAKKLLLLGEEFSVWRAWDGVRALDCLLECAPVDKARLGLVGQSGGGTLTSVILSIDPRYAFAAPACYITTYRHNLENELPVDSEQVPRGILPKGYEMADHLTGFAPKPAILLAKQDDFFDVRGTKEAFAALKRTYALLGKPGNIALSVTPGGHAIDRPSREALYAFFMKHAGLRGDAKEPDFTPRPERELWATPTGSTLAAGSTPLADLTRALRERTRRGRRAPTGAVLKKLLRLAPVKMPPPHRVLRPANLGGEAWARFALPTEAGIFTLLKYRRPAGVAGFDFPRGRKALLYFCHEDPRAEIAAPDLAPLLKGEEAVFLVDVRGLGESLSATTDVGSGLHAPYGPDFFYASHAHMMGSTTAGQRVHDALGVLRYLGSFGYKEFHLVGQGLGALTALFAAAFVPGVKRLDLVRALESYDHLVDQGFYRWPLSGILPDALLSFDLPDLEKSLGERVKINRIGRFDTEFKA